jgi:hypothetical protein
MNRVAQVGNLLCRRLPVGDTADCQSALHRRGSWPVSGSEWNTELLAASFPKTDGSCLRGDDFDGQDGS